MSDREIFRALNQQLSTFTFTPQPEFAWQPTTYKPTPRQAHCIPIYQPVNRRPLSTSPIQTRVNIIFRVECFVDEEQGLDLAYALADGVSQHFFPVNGMTNDLLAGTDYLQINRLPEVTEIAPKAGFVGVASLITAFAII